MKIINLLILSSCALIFSSCSLIMPTTQVLFESKNGIELVCPPERVKVVCVPDAGDDHGQVLDINVLNDRGEVEQFLYSRMISPKECAKEIKAYGKILKQGRAIYITGKDEMASEPDNINQRWVDFPGLGRFKLKNRFYVFMVMKNEKGDCMGQYKLCPVEGKDFYIRNPEILDWKK